VASTLQRARCSRRASTKLRCKRGAQLGLTIRSSGRGGWRAHAGRKPIPFERRDRVAHRRRPALPKNCPLHVTVRLVEGLPRLRGARTWRCVRRCIALAHKPGFRVVHVSMLDDHLHLLVEADDQLALTAGMQGLGIRLAARLRAMLGFMGPLFAERYHARPLRTPREVRHALAYVLGNARKHAAQRGRTMPPDWVDPFSSAPHFAGWAIAVRTNLALCGPPVTLPPRTWLLRIGWAKAGPLHPGVVPGETVDSRRRRVREPSGGPLLAG
jgi:putative transposase